MSNWAEQLEEDLDWREGELAVLKILTVESVKGSVRETTLLRAMWTLLYAHFEGFCKYAWDLYLDALQGLGLNRVDAIDCLACFSLKKEFKGLRGNNSDEAIWKFNVNFNNLTRDRLIFEEKLETKSNLWPEIYRENTHRVGLGCEMLDVHERKIKTLVDRRNNIAHGKKMIIKNIDDYKVYENAAIVVMHELALSIVDSLQGNKYLKR